MQAMPFLEICLLGPFDYTHHLFSSAKVALSDLDGFDVLLESDVLPEMEFFRPGLLRKH